MIRGHMNSHRLKVVEEFASIQGTGHLVGTPQYFTRLGGCSVTSCPIRRDCDEPEAISPRAGVWVRPEDVALRAVRSMGRGGWLHVTGGEPLDQLDAVAELGMEAARVGLRTHYQTSGTIRADFTWDWITVSPKCSAEDLEVKFGQEMVIVDTGQSVSDLREYTRHTRFWFYYLCPLHGADISETAEKVRRLSSTQHCWSLTDQMHKVWKVK